MEIWDGYLKDGSQAGVDLVRGEPIPEGLYHLVCEILVRHADGDYLVMQRDLSKPNFGGYFEATAGGSALKGEDKITCAKRELLEETGIVPDSLEELGTFLSHNTIYFQFLCVTGCDKSSVLLQEGETISYQWLTEREFIAFVNSDKLIPVHKIRYGDYFKKLGYMLYIRDMTYGAEGTAIIVRQYDIPTGQTRVVYQESGMQLGPWKFLVTEEGGLYLSGWPQDGSAAKAGFWKLENDQHTEVKTWDMDGDVFFTENMAVFVYMQDGKQVVEAVSLDGERICEGTLPDEIPGVTGNPSEYSYGIFGGSGDYIIMELKRRTSEHNGYHTILIDVANNMEVTLLWTA